MRWIALIAFVLATTPTWSQTLTLEGNVSAQTTGATAVLRADRIRFSCPTGVTATSGSLRLELWATATPFAGGASIQGYRTAYYQLPQQLRCGESYTNVSSGTITYTAPPNGYANFSLLLTEFQSGGYAYVAYANLSGSGSNGNLVNVSCSNNVVVLKFWDNEVQDGDLVTVRLGSETLTSNFNMNSCGGPSEPSSGPCVFTRTLPANSVVPLEITANSTGTTQYNSAALKVIGACTPEYQEWYLSVGEVGRININTGQGGGTTGFALQVSRLGTGSGTVTSSPSGINCGSTCSANFNSGTNVTLTAASASGSVFAGWTGECAGTQTTCSVSMSQSRNVSATFNSQSTSSFVLNVGRIGVGSGTVTSSPAGISCGTDCSETYASNTQVVLTASASAGSSLSSWTGCDSQSGTSCTVTMNASRSVTATFGTGGTSLDEPSIARFTLPIPNPANANCPAGFFSAIVDDGPGAGLIPGAFGMEVLLDDPGTRVLAGGLNFGGLIDVGQVGFAGFTIANAANEQQTLNLNLTGSPSSSSTGSLPVRIRISRRTATTSTSVFENTATISLTSAYVTSLNLPPAFYEVTVAPTNGTAGGAPEGQFFFSLTTSFTTRPGGGFQGGAVVGGYHATHPFGGVSGFAAFCLATPHTTSIRVLSQPSYGPTGARDLRLRVQDALGRELLGGTTLPVADSVSNFSLIQGQAGWRYGYYAFPPNPSSFTQMAAILTDSDPIYGSYWGESAGRPPWTALSARASHPNGTNSGAERWAVRRWTSTIAGNATISGSYAMAYGNCGDGTTVRLSVNGTTVLSRTVDFFDTSGGSYSVPVTLAVGTIVDLITEGRSNDSCDSTIFTAVVTR